MSMLPLTRNLSREFAGLLRDWPADAVPVHARCRLLMLDGLAVAVAGMHEEPGPSIVAGLLRAQRTSGPATVIGDPGGAPLTAAARINGMAMHVLDFEPMWSPANHALSPLLPALLALAEWREQHDLRLQGLAVLRALAKGIEAQGRLRLSSRQFEPAKLGFHPPGVVGAISAALACADLLGLDHERTTHAIGIAASRTGGLLVNVGSHTKALHCGDAAANGLESALLASSGFSANADALGGPRGWGHAYFGGDFDPEALLQPIGAGRVLEPGPSWKLFPSQYGTHFGITAALDAHARLPAGGDVRIERVELRAPPMPYIDRPSPATGLEGKFSWQYTASLALLDGRVDTASFTDVRRHSPDVEALLQRFHLIADPTIGSTFDAMHVDLTVTLDDGQSIRSRCDTPLGSWRRPVEPARIVDKARALLGAARADQLLAAMPESPSSDFSVRALMTSLRATRSPSSIERITT
ncbi:hypothetical protein BH09PSE6_BH09PSE6_26810 [soil metagenome]